MASSSLLPGLADSPPTFSMASSSLLPPSLSAIEQAMVTARFTPAHQGSTWFSPVPAPWSSDPTDAAPRQNPWRTTAAPP
ncbi:hypothetical protein ZWY2020_035314 [Hordeum vulgare]|nr:hypothetical protein ZWY2020_035314 [Hordeum vulgare]